ncbi:SRPBCC family protein [Microbacterium aurantiacum]|uniref:SRPBCC family protein n=1 Tax=Microbacterium aurantiacum TaxID=162393 RepID=UPI000C8019C3
MSNTITSDIEVDVPIRTAYEQWTQFESFPEYLSGVEDVTQLDDTTTHWIVNIGGVRREFDARIVDQVPDDHVVWRSLNEVAHEGRVSFRPDPEGGTHVELSMKWEPEGFVEKAGAALHIDDMVVKRDLQRFKEFIEERHTPTGAWRGEIHGGTTTDTAATPSSGTASDATVSPTTPSASGIPQAPRDDVRGDDPDLRV